MLHVRRTSERRRGDNEIGKKEREARRKKDRQFTITSQSEKTRESGNTLSFLTSKSPFS